MRRSAVQAALASAVALLAGGAQARPQPESAKKQGTLAQKAPGALQAPPPSKPTPGSGPAGGPAQPADAQRPPPLPPPALVARLGRFDLDQPLAQLAKLPDLKACAETLTAPAGHAECVLPANDERLGRIQLAWDEGKPGGELLALRLIFDPALALPLTDLEWQLTRGWGQPVLEQLRRDRDTKVLTLQWEDSEHRATLEAAGPLLQPSRAVAIVLERKPRVLPGELATLRPRPFPNMRVRLGRRVDWEGQVHAVVWGTSLTPAQEALGEAAPSWANQRSYVGVWRLEPASGQRSKRWKPLWERVSGEEEDQDPQRIVRVDTRDVTGDGTADLEIELSCPSCGQTTSEVLVKTVRAGKVVDLLSKKELFRAQVDMGPSQIRIREPEGEDGTTVSTYSYDRSKGAFVLAHEERLGQRTPE